MDGCGLLRFDAYMEAALYAEPGGFYSAGGGAGRREGDFLTSVEVGPLFGRLLARLADRVWEELGRPADFAFVDAGAGRGTLARSVLAARPACAAALRYVLVERSAALRAAHADLLASPPLPGVQVESRPDLPAEPLDGLIVANELLDNLPVRLLQRTPNSWSEVHITASSDAPDHPPDAERPPLAPGIGPFLGGLAERPGPASPRQTDTGAALPLAPGIGPFLGGPAERPGPPPAPFPSTLVERLLPLDANVEATANALAPDAPVGGRIPLATAAVNWVGRARQLLRRGRLVVLDYTDTSPSLAARPHRDWVRTYRAGIRGHEPLADPGRSDITVEVPIDQILAAHPGAALTDQAAFLRSLGIDDLTAEGRTLWQQRAAVGDLAALEARSRTHEAAALCDPSGLGAFAVTTWRP